MKRIVSIVGLGALLIASSTFASTILTQTPQGNYANNVLNGSEWTQMTGYLTAQHTITSTADFSDLAQLNDYDAVWVDQELGGVLSADEISALTSYASAGGKLVLVGENNSWDAWNASIMPIVGGGYISDCSYEVGTAISGHSLAIGVGSISNVCGSELTNAGSPEILFSNNFAGVYSVGAGEVLVFLDSNWNADDYINDNDNAVFAENIADWIGEPTVETFSVAASVVGGNGSVSCDPASVAPGGSSTCTAVPDAGWQVSGWTGDCAAAGASETCTLDNIQVNQTSTVSFEAIPLTVVATVASGNGSVTCDPASVAPGGSSTCTAVPDAGWQVSAWTGACAAAGTGETCTLDNIQADASSTVSFEAIPVTTYPIEFTVSGLLEGSTPGDAAYSVILSNNGGDDITVFSDGVYSFPTELPDGATYDIAVAFQPDNQTCTVENGNGTVAAAPVTDPTVTCVDNVAPPITVEAVPVPVDSRAALVLLTIVTMVLGLAALSNRQN